MKINILFILLLFSLSVLSKEKCKHPFIDYTLEDLKVREKWDHFGFKDSSKQQYFAHMIDLRYRNAEKYPIDSWAYKLLKSPNLLSRNPMLSASVISNSKQKTVFNSRVGFILDVPCELVGPMYHWDMGSGGWRDQTLEVRYKKHHDYFPEVITPSELLSRSAPKYHNEVLILGSHKQSSVKVKGIVLGCHPAASHLFLENSIKIRRKVTKDDLSDCLMGYKAKEQVINLLIDNIGKYDFYFKVQSSLF